MPRPSSIFAPLLLLLPAAMPAQPAGTSLLRTSPAACFTRVEGGAKIAFSTVNVEGQEFDRAWRLASLAESPNAWDLRLRCFDTLPVMKGDSIVASFFMRTIAPGRDLEKGLTTFVFEKGADPYTKSVQTTVFAGADWQRFDLPFTALEDYSGTGAAGNTYNLSFWVNFPGQTVEIGGFSILDYGPNFDFRTLHLSSWPYAGQDPDAPWRAAAAERIEKLRKGDIHLMVRNAAGEPVPGASIHVKMLRHAFCFGTAVDASTLASNIVYRQAVADNFNCLVLENDLKWPNWERSRAPADFALTWAAQQNFVRIRGHNVVWPSKSYLPQDVVALLNASPVDRDALRSRIDQHVRDVVGWTRGRVTEWDVINEPYTNTDLQTVLGNSEMVRWFQLARQADPDIQLFLNDYNILEAGGGDLAHISGTARILQFLLDNGAPLDALGLQGHFATNLTSPDRAFELLDRWSAMVPNLEVTEFDVDTADQELQAQYTRDFLTLCFSHPALRAFVMWGFWEGRHWKPQAAMLRRDWSQKPNYGVWRDLVYRQWWTDVTLDTGEDGTLDTRGFAGDYLAEVFVDGVTLQANFTVKAGEGTTVEIQPALSTTAAGATPPCASCNSIRSTAAFRAARP